MRFLFFLLTALFFTCSLSAQNAAIELKNGNSLKGKIIEMKSDAYTDIEVTPGNIIRIDAADIETISIINPNTPPPTKTIEEKEPQLERRKLGWYHYTAMRLAFGTGDFNNNFNQQRELLLGFGLSHETGYRFSPLFDVGMGFGLDWIRQRRMAPIYATGRVFFSKKALTGFFSLSAGANMGIAGNGNNFSSFQIVEKAYHGFYAYPALGLQIPLSNGFQYLIELGYSIQSAAFDVRENMFQGGAGATGYESAVFYRLSLRLGMMF